MKLYFQLDAESSTEGVINGAVDPDCEAIGKRFEIVHLYNTFPKIGEEREYLYQDANWTYYFFVVKNHGSEPAHVYRRGNRFEVNFAD
jgi:hypothetical protein